MTKKEIINEIFSNVRWEKTAKEANVKYAMKWDKSYLERIYNSYLNDKDHYLFYANLLVR